jgi:hypothetical protein
MNEISKNEFGKWLMDIAKYVVTAIIISSFLGSFGEIWMVYAIGFLVAGIFLAGGLVFLNRKK